MKKLVLTLTVAFAAAGIIGRGTLTADAASTGVTPTPTPASSPAVSPSATPPRIDDPNDIIRVETELVNINVRVVDRNNRPVNGLKQSDFKVFEDGKEQQIDFFTQSEVPTNYGLVVDNSGSMRQQLDKVIEAGKVLVGTNKPEDETLVIRFVGKEKIEIVQNFTSNKQDLNDALDNLYIEGGQTAIRDAVYLAVESIDEYEKSRKGDDHKRRALVLVTDGEDRASYYNDKQLLDLLRESEVQIYVIGFLDDLNKDGGFISKSPRDKAKAFLDSLASETGGKAYYPASPAELPALAKEISNELRTQYSIGYIPSNDRNDGTYRSIKVQVADGPDGAHRVPVTRAGRTAEGGSAATTPKKTN
ncbi:MAG TPA: VWA domain-containing protein [Pyrinomonadaceae bacterium]|nr:VWA domain-containing protein [Pyrinomonadaceae bacterium]